MGHRVRLRFVGAFLVVFTLIIQTTFAQGDGGTSGAPTLVQKKQAVAELLKNVQADGAAAPGADEQVRLLQRAVDAYAQGNERLGDTAVTAFLSITPEDTIGDVSNQDLVKYVTAQNPETVSRLYQGIFLGMAEGIWRIYEATEQEQTDTAGKILRVLSPFRRAALRRSAESVQVALIDLSTSFRGASPEKLKEFQRVRSEFFFRFDALIESLASRWGTAEARAQDFVAGVQNLTAGGPFVRNGATESALLSSLYQREGSEEYVRTVLINRQSVTATVACALIVSEIALIPFTGGASAVATPETLAMIHGVQTVARGVIAANSAVNIIDRYNFQGWKGLASLSTLIDGLVIMSMLPTPSVALMKTTDPLFKRFMIFKTIAQTQYQASTVLAGVGITYGTWQCVNASRLSRESQSTASPKTEREIRGQCVTNIALGILGGLSAYKQYQAGLKQSPEYATLMKEATVGPMLARQHAQALQLLPWNPIKGIVGAVKAFGTAPLINGISIAKGIGQLGYDVLFWNSAVMMSYTYPDFAFMKNTAPLPDLKNGEVAVALSGFDPTDLLQYAFKSDYAHRRELVKYQKDTTYFYDEFGSPSEFIAKLREISQTRGKIRYLKIMTHGVPGKLVTRAALGSGTGMTESDGDGFIDADTIRPQMAALQAISREVFAPDVHIVIVSCLVGANLDHEIEVLEQPAPMNAGDEFIETFGEAFLVNGGVIDTSRRIIAGIDAMAGSGVERVFSTGFKDRIPSGAQAELAQVRSWLDQYNDDAVKYAGTSIDARPYAAPSHADREPSTWESQPSTTGSDASIESGASSQEIASAMGHRLIEMHRRIYEVIYKYGIAVEGSWFSEKHRQDRFEAQN